MRLSDKSLLVLSHNFNTIIREQTIAASRFVGEAGVIVPQPRFPGTLLKLPLVSRRLVFLRLAQEACKGSAYRIAGPHVWCPKFFTLPISVMRQRVPIFSARCSIRSIKRNNVAFDLIHAHRLDVGYTGAVLKEVYDRPLVVTVHGQDVYDYPFQSLFNYSTAKYVVQRMDRAVAVCRSDAKKLLSLGLPSDKITVIPNGFNEKLFKPVPQESARAKLGLPIRKRILLSVGTLWPVKGHIHLINSMALLSRFRKDLLLIMIGSGPSESDLRRAVERLNLGQFIRFVGSKPHSTIPLWMNACDFLILPSLNEGLPSVIPEAMACGKPVVGTRVGGVPDVVDEDVSGVLVNPESASSLADGITEALDRRWVPEKIQRHAMKFSLNEIVKQILQVYERALTRFG